jgi:hypothetical protein
MKKVNEKSNEDFKLTYTNKQIYEKIINVEKLLAERVECDKTTEKTITAHQYLIWGAYGFTFTVFGIVLGIII